MRGHGSSSGSESGRTSLTLWQQNTGGSDTHCSGLIEEAKRGGIDVFMLRHPPRSCVARGNGAILTIHTPNDHIRNIYVLTLFKKGIQVNP